MKKEAKYGSTLLNDVWQLTLIEKCCKLKKHACDN